MYSKYGLPDILASASLVRVLVSKKQRTVKDINKENTIIPAIASEAYMT